MKRKHPNSVPSSVFLCSSFSAIWVCTRCVCTSLFASRMASSVSWASNEMCLWAKKQQEHSPCRHPTNRKIYGGNSFSSTLCEDYFPFSRVVVSFACNTKKLNSALDRCAPILNASCASTSSSSSGVRVCAIHFKHPFQLRRQSGNASQKLTARLWGWAKEIKAVKQKKWNREQRFQCLPGPC